MRSTRLAAFVLALLLAAATACGGETEEKSSGTPNAATRSSATPAPTATRAAEPTSTAEAGVPETVRQLIGAVRKDGTAALEARVRYSPVPCTTRVEGIGGPPECAAGEAEGTPVNVVFATSCEGYYTRALQFDQIALGVFGSGDVLHGVYRIGPSSRLAGVEPWAGAKYAIVLNRIGPTDVTLPYVIISDGNAIIGTATGCGETPEQWVTHQRLGPPIPAPE